MLGLFNILTEEPSPLDILDTCDRRRLLLRTPGPVPFGTCICSNVETILSWTCHIYGPFEFRHFWTRPTEDAFSSGHLVLSLLGLAFVLMLRPFFPELVIYTDLLRFEHPSVLLFAFICWYSLKLYCRYLYTRPCMINHIWGLKQLWLQVNGHAWFHLQRLRWPVRNGEGAKNSKWKYMSPAWFEPTPRQSTTGKLQRLRPLGHAG